MGHPTRQRIESLFEEALDLATAERADWLPAACEGDAGLRAEVEAMLAAHELAERLLDGGPPAASLPERIGSYRVLRELGRGGMGRVYLAERSDGQFRRRVAIKRIGSSLEDDPLYQRFLAERQILAGLDHPNIARMLDGGITDDGRPYLVMEYVDGLPITTYCDRHGHGVEERIRLFLDVCAAVRHAHQNLVIHRDLKPSNILVTPAGEVKLLDFGIAKLVNPTLSGAAPPVTRTESRPMTPEYASPEQVRGEALTAASDLYSLGVLLYELLCGHPPYRLSSRSAPEMLERVCERDPERPSVRAARPERVAHPDGTAEEITPERVAAARGVSPERLQRRLRGDLDAIVGMALRKEPGRRYPSVDRLGQDLERHLEGLPVQAQQGSRRYRLAKFIRRHRLEVTTASLIGLSLVTGLGAATRQSRRAETERVRAEEARVEAEAVTGFLIGLFEASDPAQVLGDEITARDLLRRGSARAEELRDQPLVQARMLDAVGRVYRSLGRYDDGEPLLERALSLRREALAGAPDPRLAESLSQLARVRRERGDYAAAEALYREALAMRRALGGPSDPGIALALVDLAYVLHLRGDAGAAEPLYRDALARLRAAYGPEHPDVAAAMSNLGLLLRQQDDFERAEPLLREALAMRRRLLGNEHPDVAVGAGLLAVLLRQTGRFDDAEALFRESLDISRRVLGPDHPDVAHTMNGLAILMRDRGDFAAADSLASEVLALRRRRLGGDHPSVATSLYILGDIRARRGDVAGADSLLRHALALRRRIHPDGHPDVERVRQELQRCCGG